MSATQGKQEEGGTACSGKIVGYPKQCRVFTCSFVALFLNFVVIIRGKIKGEITGP